MRASRLRMSRGVAMSIKTNQTTARKTLIQEMRKQGWIE
jgi:hypothetical protein